MSSPMPLTHREVYLSAAASAIESYLQSPSSQIAQIQVTVPQLNPELDVYDRRFLLQLAWAVVDVTVSSFNLPTRVLIQGTGAYGAIPLSIAGLRRNFDADVSMSRESWPEEVLRVGELSKEEDLTEEDQVVVVISPTNAVSVPTIVSLMDMVARVKGKPVILLNPRLADVPSHSGVMQVGGRKERLEFLEGIEEVFCVKLLFDAGTNYPLRGILYRAYPGNWEVWKAQLDGEDKDEGYYKILEQKTRPSGDEIGKAFSKDRYARQKQLIREAEEDGSIITLRSVFKSLVGTLWPF